ncbi:uncharacterized protein LOC135497328 [Lineus longissimus]|uniref:uncharacterized protein LOC135497328 n=1 Tax=Lineus longissimus TaxID=88925 RepID=UPI002B4EB196
MKLKGISIMIVMATLAAMTPVSGEIITTACPTSSTCRSGNCAADTKTGTESCVCGPYFSGASCETVRLDVPDWTITSTTVSFKWPRNITIKEYEFVCYEKYTLNPSIILTRNLTQNTFDTLTFTGLQAGAITYVICLVDSMVFNVSDPNIFSTALNKNNENCFSFSTMYDGRDPATLVAYGIAIMIGSIFLLSLVVKFFFDVRQNKVRLREKELKSLTRILNPKLWMGGRNSPEPTNSRRNGETGKPSLGYVDRILTASSSSPNLLASDGTHGRSASSADIRASGKKAKYIPADKRSIGSHGSRGSVPRKSNSNLAVLVNMKDSLGEGRSGSRTSILDMTFDGQGQGQPNRSQSVPGIDMM